MRIQQALDQLCTARGIPGAVFGVVDDGAVTVAASRNRQPQHGSARRPRDAVPGRVDRQVVHRHGDHAARRRRPSSISMRRCASTCPTWSSPTPTVSKTLTSRQVLTHTAGIDGDRLDEDFACGRGDDCVAALRRRPHRPAPDHRPGRTVVVLQQRLRRARPGHRGAHRDDLRAGDHHAASSNRSAPRTRCSSPATW